MFITCVCGRYRVMSKIQLHLSNVKAKAVSDKWWICIPLVISHVILISFVFQLYVYGLCDLNDVV